MHAPVVGEGFRRRGHVRCVPVVPGVARVGEVIEGDDDKDGDEERDAYPTDWHCGV